MFEGNVLYSQITDRRPTRDQPTNILARHWAFEMEPMHFWLIRLYRVIPLVLILYPTIPFLSVYCQLEEYGVLYLTCKVYRKGYCVKTQVFHDINVKTTSYMYRCGGLQSDKTPRCVKGVHSSSTFYLVVFWR